MSEDAVNVRGMLVPFDIAKAEEYGFRRKRTELWSAPLEPPIKHYRKSCSEVGPGKLRDASSNRRGFIEAGYCLGTDEGDGTMWYISIEPAPGP